jgi:pyruvate dehydrogenase E1 component
VGAVMVEAAAAASELEEAGIGCDLVCLTSPDLVFRAFQARNGLGSAPDPWILDQLLPADRVSPIVSVLDGHPHTLSFLAAIRPAPIACLGVSDFGQSGDVDDLYGYFGIDADTIVGAAVDLLEGAG